MTKQNDPQQGSAIFQWDDHGAHIDIEAAPISEELLSFLPIQFLDIKLQGLKTR